MLMPPGPTSRPTTMSKTPRALRVAESRRAARRSAVTEACERAFRDFLRRTVDRDDDAVLRHLERRELRVQQVRVEEVTLALCEPLAEELAVAGEDDELQVGQPGGE